MSRSIYKALNRSRSAIRHSYLIRVQSYSTSLQSINDSPNRHSFSTSYLINSCGFPPEKAFSVSRYVQFKAPDKPDSVLAFLKSQGFTQTQILRIVRCCPAVLLCDPEKILFPKLQFFKSKGMSSADVAKLLTFTPSSFKSSLEKQIIPFVELLNSLLQSEEKTIYAIKRFGRMLSLDPKTWLLPNLECLKEAGIPNKHIAAILMQQPRVLLTSTERFRQVLEDVMGMGFNPSKSTFLVAVHAMRSMTKSTWEKKLEVYKKWGWSKENTLVAFRNFPRCMTVSEDKIMKVMDYLVNKMGQDSSTIQRTPKVISMSLQKRIIPRCALYEVLLSKGLIKNGVSLLAVVNLSEKRFLKLLDSHKKEAPELLKLYREKLGRAK